jgi:hypothetical protein
VTTPIFYVNAGKLENFKITDSDANILCAF